MHILFTYTTEGTFNRGKQHGHWRLLLPKLTTIEDGSVDGDAEDGKVDGAPGQSSDNAMDDVG
eukprot:9520191-Karenia_brevis.AAC.1